MSAEIRVLFIIIIFSVIFHSSAKIRSFLLLSKSNAKKVLLPNDNLNDNANDNANLNANDNDNLNLNDDE